MKSRYATGSYTVTLLNERLYVRISSTWHAYALAASSQFGLVKAPIPWGFTSFHFFSLLESSEVWLVFGYHLVMAHLSISFTLNTYRRDNIIELQPAQAQVSKQQNKKHKEVASDVGIY